MMVTLIPLLLFGTKYVIDQRTLNEFKINDGKEIDYQKLVNDISLAVAENWNPGLTLGQQKNAIHKVADEHYNSVASDNLISRAVKNLDISHWKKSDKQGGVFEPLKVGIDKLSISRISYETKTKYMNRYGFTNTGWNPNFAMWRTIDEKTDPEKRISEFDEMQVEGEKYVLNNKDIFGVPMIKGSQFIVTTPNVANNYATYLGSTSYTGTAALIKSTQETYVSRDSSSYMNISVTSDDKIKVSLNGKEAVATPAKCNVDIVLAVPVNGAASNRYNRDAASDTAGNPQSEESSDNLTLPAAITETPIYQMGQACKAFVKKFYHTQGVYMSLIPYSAKVSLAPGKASYARAIETFSESYFTSNPLTNRKMCGAALYGTYGVKNNVLAKSYSWGTQKTGYPIMCRRGDVETPNDYGQNKLAKGNLTSTANPNTEALKYQRMNLNPCYLGYANMLSMKCDKTCTTYLPNPYYMIEPTNDLVKIYEMCNALYPIYDLNNVSNFVFIPIEWARNFFQTWTNPTSASTTTGSSDSAVFSKPAKSTTRKKALILLVNKPDWFEPGELTYVGFDNDYSDIPTYESDRINFSINYNDTTRSFLYNESYNGTIAGPKKILTYTTPSGTLSKGTYYYASGTATGRLTFPRKGVILVRVDRYNSGSTATFTINGSSYTITRPRTFCVAPSSISSIDSNGNYYIEFTMTNINLIFAEISNRNYESVTPSCSLSGTTSATGSSQQTAYVNTNVLEPIYVKVRPTSASGTVKFSNISSYTMDGTSYSAGTSHTLTTAKTFTFPGGSLSSSGYSTGSNFGSNYGINKIGYTLNNATITGANIAAGNQILRYRSAGKDPGLAIYNANTGTSESSYTSSYYKYWTIVTMGLNNVFIKWVSGYNQSSYDCSYTDYYDCNCYQESYSCNCYNESYSCNCSSYSCNCSSYSCNCYNESYTYSCSDSTYGDPYGGSNEACFSSNITASPASLGNALAAGNEISDTANWSKPRYRGGQFYTSSGYMTAHMFNCDGRLAQVFSSVQRVSGSNGYCYSYYVTVYRRNSSGTCTGTRRKCSTCQSCDTCQSCSTCTRQKCSTCYRTKCSTCSRTVPKTCYIGSGGTMYYSTLNTANVRSGTDRYSQSVPWRSTSTPSSYSSWGAGSSYGTYSAAGGQSAVFYIVNNTGATGQQLTEFYAKNNGQAITWGGMNQSETWVNNNQGISANSSYIRFNGDSTITVTITPNVIDGYIYYKTPNQGSSSKTISGSDYQLWEINPTTHYYEKTSTGYRVALVLQDAELDTSYGAQFVTTPSTDYRYKAIEKSGTNVRYINYANSGNASYDSSYIYGNFSTYYNGVNRAIASNSSYAYISAISPKTLWGDIVHVMEENSSASNMPPYVELVAGENGLSNCYLSGTTRIFAPITRNSQLPYFGLTERSGADSTTQGGALDLLTTNITYPSNYVLYQGGYQTSTSLTPTAAVAKVTEDLCSKLKSDQGSNLRIYVIKYRKQEKYKTFPTYADGSSTSNHDYSKVDGCATSTSYVYTISNEADLNSRLNAIATEIQTWAGYKAAE